MRKLFKDVATSHLFCNVDDEELYRSTDDGVNWEHLTNDFTWTVDANGRTHVSWADPSYPTSYRKCEDCGHAPAVPEFWPYCSQECKTADAMYRENHQEATPIDDGE